MLLKPPDIRQASPIPFERWLAPLLLASLLLALLIRIPLLFHAWPGPDEFEHLHAAAAVANGQVPYRDFWQIHTPLLYYLMAPVVALMGEDLRIVYVGRGLMLFCIVLILLRTYQIARACFDSLTGLLAVFLLSYLLLWWRPAYEFRPDIPQTLLVLIGLWRFMQSWTHQGRGDLLASGAILGVSFWLLTKTLFPLIGLTLVFVLSSSLRRSRDAFRQNLANSLLFLAGFATPLLVGAMLLWVAGALPSFIRWVVIGALRSPDRFWAFLRMELDVHFVFFALALVGMGLAVTRMVRARLVDEFRLSPLLATSSTAAVYLFLMPGPYPQSALPFLPLAAMYGASVLREVTGRALRQGQLGQTARGAAEAHLLQSPTRLAWVALAGLLLCGSSIPPLYAVLTKAPPLKDQWPNRRRMMRYVLALTSPGDSVFDDYGVNIYRPHATYYYRLAGTVILWLRSGTILDTEIVRDLERNHCKVAIFAPLDDTKLPPNLRKFLLSHYVFTGFRLEEAGVFVAGQVLRRADLTSNRATLALVASTEYAVRVRGGVAKVYIDGQLYRSPLFLTQGTHEVAVEGEFEEVIIIFNRALSVPIG